MFLLDGEITSITSIHHNISHNYNIPIVAYISLYIYIYMVPCPVFPPPPMGWGGGMMPLWWCIYIHTYLPTYLPTYIHTYIPLHYLTLPYLTLHSIHTYIHTYQHTNIPTYQHTNIPTYQHTNIPTYQHTTTTGHRGGPEEPYHHHKPQGGGGPEEPYHHHRPQGGGGPEEPDDTVHPYPLVGGGGGVANAAPYIAYIYIYINYTFFFYTSHILSNAVGRIQLGSSITVNPPGLPKSTPRQPKKVGLEVNEMSFVRICFLT